MEFKRIITNQDIENVKSFMDLHKDNSFVKIRLQRNVIGYPGLISKESFWKCMVGCLLTTQQRSGPNSKITRFIGLEPFPLEYNKCKQEKNLIGFSLVQFKKFGGIRRIERISEEIQHNYDYLENGGWEKIMAFSDVLIKIRKEDPNKEHIKIEREACILLQELKGIGPKQSRNLRQALGLLRYEIPIDSRIVKWLNLNGFPFELSAKGLSDESYYELLTDGIEELCSQSDILPCMLDASVFASFDPDTWDKKTNVR